MAAQQAHFVPRTYLKQFAYDAKRRKVYAFNTKTNDVRSTSIETICSQRYIYRFEDESGQPSDEIEDVFAQKIEPLYNTWLNKIKACEILSNADIADLAHYVALQHVRVPTTFQDNEEISKQAFKEAANEGWAKLLDDGERHRVLAEIEKEHPEKFAEYRKRHPDAKEVLTKTDIQDMIDGKGYELEVNIPKNNLISLMMESIPYIAEKIVASGWNFISAPDGTEFITSDTPCFVMIPTADGALSTKHGGFSLPGAHVVMPLSKDTCLMIEQGDYYQRYMEALPVFVDHMNQMAVAHAKQYLIGATESVVKHYSNQFATSHK